MKKKPGKKATPGKAEFVCTHGVEGEACGQCLDDRHDYVGGLPLSEINLHQYFCAAALQGLLSNQGFSPDDAVRDADDLAEMANIVADAMVAKIAEGSDALTIEVFETTQD